MVTTSLRHNFIARWNLVYIIQLKKMKKTFSMKFYSLGLLLKNVNRNIRSCFSESIAYLFEFGRTACRNTSTMAWHDWSTECGHQRRRHVVRSVSVPVTVGLSRLLSSKRWHVVWCPMLSSLQLLIALNRLTNHYLSMPKTRLAETWLPHWCFLVLKAL